MKIAVLNYQTGEVDIVENVPDEEGLKAYFTGHSIEGVPRELIEDDDLIRLYLDVICHYHMSEIDWMVIQGINFREMGNINNSD